MRRVLPGIAGVALTVAMTSVSISTAAASPAPRAAELTCSDTFTGGPSGTGTAWSDPTNWSTGVVPGPADVACIDVDVTAPSGTTSVAGLQQTAETLTLPTASTLVVADLNSSDSTLSGPGTLLLSTGGESELGDFTLSNGLHLDNDGDLSENLGSIDATSVLDNAGTLAVAEYGSIWGLSAGSTGEIINESGATISYGANDVFPYPEIAVPIIDSGTIAISQGELIADLGSVFGDPTVSGPGVLQIEGELNGPMTYVNDPELALGDLSVDTSLVANGVAELLVVGTVSGSGTVTIPASVNAQFSAAYTFSQGALDGNVRLINDGNLIAQGAYGVPEVEGKAVLENAGSLSVSGEGLAGDGTLLNDATGAIAGGPIQCTTTNNGTLVSSTTSDYTQVERLTNLSAGVLRGGTYDAMVSPHTSYGPVILPGPITTNDASITAGALETTSGGNALASLARNVGSLTLTDSLADSAPLGNDGTLTIDGATLSVPSYRQAGGTTTLATGAALDVDDGAGSAVVAGGRLDGDGTVDGSIGGSGTVLPALDDAALTVTNDYAPSAHGTYVASIAGPGPVGQGYAQLDVHGTAALHGRLVISTAAGYTPQVGTTLTIIDAQALSGSFSQVVGTRLAGGEHWVVNYDGGDVTLTASG